MDHQGLLSLSCLIDSQYRKRVSNPAAADVWRQELRNLGSKMSVWQGELRRLEKEAHRVFGINGW